MLNKADIRKLSFPATGTIWHIEYDNNLNLDSRIIEQVQLFENLFSRFKQDSKLTELNKNKILLDPPSEMIELLTFALKFYQQSNKVFNISIGGVLAKNGYGPGTGILSNDLTNDITILKNSITIKENIWLDFGGFGKGWLVDKLANFLKSSGSSHIVINGGGDIFVSASTEIQIALEDPNNNTKQLGFVKLKEGAVAGSSTLKRKWTNNSNQFSHIHSKFEEDPKALFIIAPNCLIADSIATTLLIDKSLEHHLREFYQFEVLYL